MLGPIFVISSVLFFSPPASGQQGCIELQTSDFLNLNGSVLYYRLLLAFLNGVPFEVLDTNTVCLSQGEMRELDKYEYTFIVLSVSETKEGSARLLQMDLRCPNGVWQGLTVTPESGLIADLTTAVRKDCIACTSPSDTNFNLPRSSNAEH